MSEWSLSGKVVLITGGGAGIGAATARELQRRGAVPVLADVDTAGMEATAASMGGDVLTVACDVTDPAACEEAVARTVERHGGLDIVWANAGVATFGPLALEDPDAWTRTIEVNVLGVYRTVHAALPAVMERRGYVAVTASLASFAHAPGMSAYSTSKAGVEAMCNALRIEMAPHGVQVASIHPSWIATSMVVDADRELRAFKRLRDALRPPLNKTYPVEKAARDIADGFERRAQRICTPSFVRVLHVARSALTTRLATRDQVEAAPDIERLFREEVAERGQLGASATRRTSHQVGEHEPAGAR